MCVLNRSLGLILLPIFQWKKLLAGDNRKNSHKKLDIYIATTYVLVVNQVSKNTVKRESLHDRYGFVP